MRRLRSSSWSVPVALGVVVVAVSVALVAGPASASQADDGGNVTAYRASNATFADAGAVESAIQNGTVEPADELVVGDTLVVAIESERLADAMAGGNGSTTVRFFDALDGEAEFRIVQTNPTPERNSKVAPTGPENATVYHDGARTYVLVRTGQVAFQYRTVDTRAEIFGGERFAVQFGYDLADASSVRDDPSGPVVELRLEPPTTTPRTTTSSPTATTSETPPATSTTMREQADQTGTDDGQADGGGTTASGQPGFGVAAALVALLVLALVRARRS